MPTEREREYYQMGFKDGIGYMLDLERGTKTENPYRTGGEFTTSKPKRKLSSWQKFVKANSKKPRFKYKSGAKKGRVNLKALGVAYRKKKRR